MAELSWVDRARALGPREAAAVLGLQAAGGRWGPCPSCHAERDSSGRRGALRLDRARSGRGVKAWCNGCGTSFGSVFDLAAWQRNGIPVKALTARGDFGTLRSVFERGVSAAADMAPAPVAGRLPEDGVRAFLRACVSLRCSSEAWIGLMCEERGWERAAVPAWAAPRSGPWPGWWPRWARQRCRLIVPAYTGAGVLAGVHARWTDAEQDHGGRKDVWPSTCNDRYTFKGLVLADPWVAVPWLRAQGEEVPEVWVCEGLTDYLTVASQVRVEGSGAAVLGIVSGSESALKVMDWSRVTGRVYVATDSDAAGDRYAEKIGAVLAQVGRSVHRVPLWRLREAG